MVVSRNNVAASPLAATAARETKRAAQPQPPDVVSVLTRFIRLLSIGLAVLQSEAALFERSIYYIIQIPGNQPPERRHCC